MPFLLLSSGARPRYLEDIVRALALPVGAEIQFRYDEGLLSDAAKELAAKQCAGDACYLCYLDYRQGAPFSIVPVREASVIEVRRFGSSFIFRMQVGRFIRNEKAEGIRKFAESATTASLPKWVSKGGTGEIVREGYWVNSLKAPFPDEYVSSGPSAAHAGGGAPTSASGEAMSSAAKEDRDSYLLDFVATVKELSRYPVFKDKKENQLFFQIMRLTSRDEKEVLSYGNQGWMLRSGREYALHIHHYYPDQGPTAATADFAIGLRTFGPVLSVLGSSILRADSEYDWKVFRFVAGRVQDETNEHIEIFRAQDSTKLESSDCEIDLRVVVRPERWWKPVQAIVLGALMSSPAVIASFGTGFSFEKLAAIVFSGLVVGFTAVYGFKRSI